MITRCIWLLRRQLGDNVNEPRFIETVATVGYRLFCDVEADEDGFGGLDEAELRHQDIRGNPQNPQAQPAVAKGFRYVISWVAPVLLICIAAFFLFSEHLTISGFLFLGAAHQLCRVRDLSFVCA